MCDKLKTEDKSGEPREKVDLEEALEAVEWAVVRQATKVPARLFVMLPTIRDVLREAITFREVTEGKQIGWYEPGTKRFCYMDVKEHGPPLEYASYTEPVYVLTKE